MTELERRALLGDREAQEELSSLGKLSTCPWCGSRMELKNGSHYGYYKTKCVFCGAESPEEGNEWIAILRSNKRPAPPIGKCGECKHWGGVDEYGDGYCKNPDGIDNIANKDDFCSKFNLKEEPMK